MIDTTKPLELADGTPVTFVEYDKDGDIVVRLRDGAAQVFKPDTGAHWLWWHYPNLRNVKPRTAIYDGPFGYITRLEPRPVYEWIEDGIDKDPTMPQFDPSKPVQTRDGRKARIICTDASGNFPIIALVENRGGVEHAIAYTTYGRLLTDGRERNGDLVNIPEPIVRYANYYRDRSGATWGHVADANEYAMADRLALIKITYTPGRGAEAEVVKEFPQ